MKRHSRYFGISLFLMSAAWAGTAWVEFRPPAALAKPLQSISTQMEGWVGREDPPLTGSVLESLHPTSYLLRTYHKGPKTLGLFIAYYALTRPGESMHSPKNCLPGGGWEILESGSTDVPVAHKRLAINKYLIQKNGAQQLVLYWYQSKQRVVASEYTGKLFRVWDAISTGDTSGSIVRISLAATPDALEDGRSFGVRVIPEVQEVLGGTGL